MGEELRFIGKVTGAVGGTVCGVDLGSPTLATIAGEDNEIEPVSGPRRRKRLAGCIRRMQLGLQKHRAKKLGLKASRRQYIRQLRSSKLYARLANIRKNAAHKLTTDVTRRFATILIEDLNVSGMAKNHSLAGAVLDYGFGEMRRQFLDTAAMHDGRIRVADIYPSTRICSCCGCRAAPKRREGMCVERWVRSQCDAERERDANAAINLQNLGLAKPPIQAPGHGASSVCASIPARWDEPRTETVHTCTHIQEGRTR
jgi:putative transposase